ncbi:MAG: LysM peptidoglycan-binding domain-containing protein [Akkermansiaceae bacterium]|nr:LysM peptidoglycan-binding domain-containing protein [Akkermansiaceae bacterium]
MKALTALPLLALGLSILPVQARTETDILRARCAEQERQIRALETEIDRLHGLVALERRRSRGAAEAVAQNATPAQATASPKTYSVKSGDTLSSIARRYHTSAATLISLNGIEDPTRLRVGEVLSLPAAKTAAPVKKSAPQIASRAPETKPAPKPAAKPAPAPKPTASGKHLIKKGDTFYSVARKYKLSVNSLKALNPTLNPNHIVIGQSLVVAGNPPKTSNQLAPTTRTISTSPAAKKTSPPAPKPAPKKDAPPVASLPKPAPKPAAAPKPAPEPKPEPKTVPKTVSSIIVMDEISFGDFARKHGATADQLNALNGLSLKERTVLAKGSELYVPGH